MRLFLPVKLRSFATAFHLSRGFRSSSANAHRFEFIPNEPTRSLSEYFPQSNSNDVTVSMQEILQLARVANLELVDNDHPDKSRLSVESARTSVQSALRSAATLPSFLRSYYALRKLQYSPDVESSVSDARINTEMNQKFDNLAKRRLLNLRDDLVTEKNNSEELLSRTAARHGSYFSFPKVLHEES